MSAEQRDTIVIGAGIVGASIAYHCAKAGLRVQVLERGEPLAGTSGATFAWLGSHLKAPADYNALSREAIALYAGMEAELEAELEYARLGSITLVRSEAALEALAQQAHALREAGAPLELLSRAQAQAREPVVSAAFAGGVHCPVDIEINPFRTTAAYLRKARALGADVRYGVAVTALTVAAGAVAGVETTAGPFRAGAVVSAAGIDSPRIGALAGVRVPVQQSRGQILVTEKTGARLRGFLAGRDAPEAGGFMLRQVRAGNVLLGYTSEPVDHDNAVTLAGFRGVAQTVADAFPALRDLAVLRAYAGIRPVPADGLPIVSTVPERPGLLFAVMHSGYTLSALVGRVVAAHLAGRDDAQARHVFARYSLARFAGREGAAADEPAGAFGGRA